MRVLAMQCLQGRALAAAPSAAQNGSAWRLEDLTPSKVLEWLDAGGSGGGSGADEPGAAAAAAVVQGRDAELALIGSSNLTVVVSAEEAAVIRHYRPGARVSDDPAGVLFCAPFMLSPLSGCCLAVGMGLCNATNSLPGAGLGLGSAGPPLLGLGVVGAGLTCALRGLPPAPQQVLVLPNIHEVPPPPAPAPAGAPGSCQNRSGLLFVGNFNHSPNRCLVRGQGFTLNAVGACLGDRRVGSCPWDSLGAQAA